MLHLKGLSEKLIYNLRSFTKQGQGKIIMRLNVKKFKEGF